MDSIDEGIVLDWFCKRIGCGREASIGRLCLAE